MSKISITKFGTLYDGAEAHLYKIQNENGFFCVSDFGCTITSLQLKNNDDSFTDVVLGLPTLDAYARTWGSFGAIIGRFANRIVGASFTLNDVTYKLTENLSGACLHGGFPTWGAILWETKKLIKGKNSGICFCHTFKDGEQGFPGNLYVEVEYILTRDNQLSMVYRAQTDKATPVSITNHSYFNLAGRGSVLDYNLLLNCDEYLELNKEGFVTGEIKPVKDTEFDFTQEKKINHYQLIKPDSIGYDICYKTPCYDSACGIPLQGKKPVHIATVTDSVSNRKMKVYTNQEGVQLYTAKYMDHVAGKNGFYYKPFEAICLETQSFPDSPNQKNFAPTVLQPGQIYESVTIYAFEQASREI